MGVKTLRQSKSPSPGMAGRERAEIRHTETIVCVSAAQVWLVAGGCKTVVSLVSVGAGIGNRCGNAITYDHYQLRGEHNKYVSPVSIHYFHPHTAPLPPAKTSAYKDKVCIRVDTAGTILPVLTNTLLFETCRECGL